MKRFTAFFLILLIILVGFAVVSACIGKPLIDLNTAERTVFVSHSPSTLYTCPVKKHSVTVTFYRSQGPINIQLKLLTLDAASSKWIESGEPVAIELSEKHTFDFPQAVRYQIQVEKVNDSYYEGNCTFFISAAP